MSRTVDERVVQMQFDNKQFESGIQTSLSSIDKLNNSLRLTGATRGLENVDTAARKVNMSGLSGAVEMVSAKFSALQVMAVTALANITNSAVNYGKRIVSSLTVEPIMTGFNEYELKMNSVQTIMAGTGEKLETVNKYLEELNAYSDRTIYSFSDMTQNIGKFTNAGVKLDDAVAAIKGVSNVAALSGANASEASRAMYNFSQALSSGYVKLIDWKSIENANMATVGFKEELIQTALAAGTVTDAGDGMYKTLDGHLFNATKNFNDVLQDQWMTTDVLVGTLRRYTDESTELGQKAYAAAQDVKTFSQMMDTLKESAQSGWAQSWEIVAGNFDEAKALWTDVNNVVGEMISSSAKARNELLQGWKDLGGRKALIDAIANAFHGVMEIIKPISEALREIFPPATAQQVFEITEKFRQLTENFRKFFTESEKGKKVLDQIKRIFKGVFASIDIGIQLFKALAKGVTALLKTIKPVGEGLLGFSANLGDAIVNFRDFIKENDTFSKVAVSLGGALGGALNKILNFVKKVIGALKKFKDFSFEVISNFVENVKKRFAGLAKIGDAVKVAFGAVVLVFQKVWQAIKPIGKKIWEAFGQLFAGIGKAFKDADFNTVLDIINTVLTGGILGGILTFIQKLIGFEKSADKTIGSFKNLVDEIKNMFGAIKDGVKTFTADMKIKMLDDIVEAILKLAIAVLLLSTVDAERLAVSIAAVSAMFVDLFGAMMLYEKIMGKEEFAKIVAVAKSMEIVAKAVVILALAVTMMSALDWEGLAKGLLGVAGTMGPLIGAAKLLDTNSGKIMKGATSFIALSIAVLILASAVKKFSAFSWEELARGLTGVAAVLVLLVGFMKGVNLNKLGFGTGGGLILLASAILVLSTSVKSLGDMSLEQIGKGLLALAGALGLVVAVTYALPKKIGGKALELANLALAIMILGKAFSIFAQLSLTQMASGVLGMAGALGLIIATMYSIPADAKKKGTALAKIAFALTTLGAALTAIGLMPLDQIGGAMLALAGALGLVVAVMYALPKDTLWIAIGLQAISLALLTFAPALGILGSLPLSVIGTGLLAIAGAFIILGVATYALQGKEFTLLAISAALLTFSVAAIAISVAVTAISTAIVAMAGAGSAAITLIMGVIAGIVALIPVILENIGKGIVAFLGIIASAGEAIFGAISTIIVAIIRVITTVLPEIFELITTFLDGLLDVLILLTPKVMSWIGLLFTKLMDFLIASVPKLMTFIGTVLDAVIVLIEEYVPKIVESAVRIIIALLDGIAAKLPDIIRAGTDVVLKFVYGLTMTIPQLVDAGFKMIIDFLNGLAKAIDDNNELLIEAVDNLMNSALEAIGQWFDKFFSSGGDLIQGLIDGIKGTGEKIWNAVTDVCEDAWNSITSFFDSHSPSRRMMGMGKNIDEGLAIGLTDYSKIVSDSAVEVGESTVDALGTALSQVSDVIDADMDMNPTIRPVVDLSDVKAGSKQLNGMFGNGTVTVNTSTKKASAISSDFGSNGNSNNNSTNSGTSITFTQNNYSPKSLDKTEIYRQTKNQFSAVQGVLNAI